MSAPRLNTLARIELTSADLDAAETFHTALDFVTAGRRRIDDPAWHALRGTSGRQAEVLDMHLGAQAVSFVRLDPPGRPYPSGSTTTDLWFQHMAIVVADMDAAFDRLAGTGAVPISLDGPQKLPPSTGSVRAYKFRDPEGHPLELLYLPPGTGDVRWQASAGLFRGIDHSALAVRDAKVSRRFYADVLGLTQGAATVNRGLAQARLDDVLDVVVDVVPMSPAHPTPHVELLGYRTGSRRPIAAATGPADIAVTRMMFDVDGLDRLDPRGRPRRRFRLAEGADAVALSDPDGHRLLLVERPAVNDRIASNDQIIAKN